MTKRRWAYYLWTFGVVAGLVWLVYGVCIDIPFAHHDTLRYFGRYFLPPAGAELQDPLYPYSWVQGRPVAAVMEDFLFRHARDFAGLSLARLFCAALAAGLAFLTAVSLRRMGLDTLTSVLLGVLVSVLPGVANCVYMVWPHYILGAVSASGAYLVWSSGGPLRIRSAAAGGLLFFSLLCYTVTAYVFLAFLAAALLWPGPEGWEKRRDDIVRGAALLAACSAAYFIFAKAVLSSRFPEALAGTYAVRQLNPSWAGLPAKLSMLFTDGAAFVLNPFSPWGWVPGGYAVLFLVLLALVRDRSWPLALRLGRLSLWALLLLTSVGVWLVAPMDTLLYRALYPGMVLCALSLAWAAGKMIGRLGGGRRMARYGVALILALGILGAHRTLALNVWNANAEMTFIRSQLARASGREIRRIHVVEPVYDGYGFNGGRVIDDGHNMNSANYDFDLSYLVKMGLWGQAPDRPLWHCKGPQELCVEKNPPGVLLLTHSRPGEPVFASAGMVVVDLNDMVRASRVFRGPVRPEGENLYAVSGDK